MGLLCNRRGGLLFIRFACCPASVCPYFHTLFIHSLLRWLFLSPKTQNPTHPRLPRFPFLFLFSISSAAVAVAAAAASVAVCTSICSNRFKMMATDLWWFILVHSAVHGEGAVVAETVSRGIVHRCWEWLAKTFRPCPPTCVSCPTGDPIAGRRQGDNRWHTWLLALRVDFG